MNIFISFYECRILHKSNAWIPYNTKKNFSYLYNFHTDRKIGKAWGPVFVYKTKENKWLLVQGLS